MGKILLIILTLYIVYYAGNILYDLFLKKANTLKTEENKEVYTMQHLAAANGHQVKIDEVEQMQPPSSFVRDESEIFGISEEEEIYIEEENTERKSAKEELKEALKTIRNEKTIESKREFISRSDLFSEEKWRDIINHAETKVQLVANIDGHKAYQSELFSS